MAGSAAAMLLSARKRIESFILAATGTVIGDLTATAPIGNVFDGNTSQAVAGGAGPCPLKGGGTGNGYVGKDFGSGVAKVMSRVNAYGGSDTGFDSSASSVTITLYGSNSSPANGTDGTSIGSTTFTNATNNTVRSITCTSSSAFRYVWIYIAAGGASNIACAEVEMWELV